MTRARERARLRESQCQDVKAYTSEATLELGSLPRALEIATRQSGLRVDETAEVAGFATEVDGVKGFPGEEQEIEKSGIENPGSGKNEGREAGDQADGGYAEGVDDGRDGQEALDAIEYERVSLAPGVPIKSRDQEKDGGEAKGVENHHAVDLDGRGESGRKFGADE